MFSPRILTVFALVATASAWPASEKPQYPDPITELESSDIFGANPWYSFLSSIFQPVFQSFGKFSHIADFGAKVTEDDNKLQVKLNVENYDKNELKVNVKGCLLQIEGTHQSKKGDQEILSSTFHQIFSMPANSSAKDVTATLDNKTLTVTVLKNGPADHEEADREVPIVETGKPSVADEKADPQNSPSLETSTLPEDDRKEPTTPGSSENSEKDNSIPHGNDA